MGLVDFVSTSTQSLLDLVLQAGVTATSQVGPQLPVADKTSGYRGGTHRLPDWQFVDCQLLLLIQFYGSL